MKKGTTSIQNIECDTAEKFRNTKRLYEARNGDDFTNDEFLQELLEKWNK